MRSLLCVIARIAQIAQSTRKNLEQLSHECGSVIRYEWLRIYVVGTNTGGTPELIEDGITGFLVSPKDVYSLAGKIEYLYKNREKCYEMGELAYKSVINTFTEENLVRKIEEIYHKVV